MRLKALLAAAALVALPLPVASGQDSCATWSMTTIADGFGRIENLEFDGKGGMLLSVGSEIDRLSPDGEVTVVADGLGGAGGLRVRGNTLYANDGGGGIVSGVTGEADGTIQKIDLKSGDRTTYSEGLTANNGLVFDQNGNAYVSRDAGTIGPSIADSPTQGVGTDMYVTKIPAADPMHPEATWSHLEDTNGLAVDPTNTWLYVSTTFNMEASVFKIALADPTDIQKIADIGSVPTDPVNGLDDMTLGTDGLLYITANGMGRVWTLDPMSGAKCMIASGLQNPTSAKFGKGKGWNKDGLYLTAWDGTVRELTP